MKRIMTAVMAGIMAVSISGCATLRPEDPVKVAMGLAGVEAFTPKVVPVKKDNYAYAKALVKLGDREYSAKHYKKALGHYDDALREWDNYIVYAKISLCLKKLGNIADARLVYKKAKEMAPKKNNYPAYKPCVLKTGGNGI